MRWRLPTVIALALTLTLHALLAVFLWRVLIAPPPPLPSASIRWVELFSPPPQLKRLEQTARSQPQTQLQSQSQLISKIHLRLAIEPPSLLALAVDLSELPSSADLLASARGIAQQREQGAIKADDRGARLLKNPRIRAPGVATPAIDRYFRDPSRRSKSNLPDVGDGLRRTIRTDEFGHQFSCSQRLGSPIDPIGMATQMSCEFEGDGASNTEEWFKPHGID